MYVKLSRKSLIEPIEQHLTLPTDDYAALEPVISGKIMELHHSKHHNTYVNSFNTANEQLQDAISKEDVKAQVALKPVINFHGGNFVQLWVTNKC